jgi:hypothetical protein
MIKARTFTLTASDGTVVQGELLADGRVKLTAGSVGATVHASLEGAIKALAGAFGQEFERHGRGGHDHEHSHSHGDHHHSH